MHGRRVTPVRQQQQEPCRNPGLGVFDGRFVFVLASLLGSIQLFISVVERDKGASGGYALSSENDRQRWPPPTPPPHKKRGTTSSQAGLRQL